jgi:transcriptional regulator with XRE-family HTH domain
MSSATEKVTGSIPRFGFRDRMAKARESAGLSQAAIAAIIGISRATVINYEKGHHRPLRPIQAAWVEVTGVDAHWLATGCECQTPETCVQIADEVEGLPRLDSNQQPVDYQPSRWSVTVNPWASPPGGTVATVARLIPLPSQRGAG